MIIQWGIISAATTGTFTFPTSFSNANSYSITFQNSTKVVEPNQLSIDSHTATGFKWTSYQQHGNSASQVARSHYFIAIGY